MAKIIDITERLDFEESPKLKVKDVELAVNDDASTMLRIMQLLDDEEGITPSDVVAMYELIFPEGERKKLDKLKLNFQDFQTVVNAAISLVTGTEMDGEGEKEPLPVLRPV